MIKTKKEDLYSVIISGDSLTLPRPWNRKRPNPADADKSTSLTDTYPYILKKLLQKSVKNKEIEVNNYSHRGYSSKNAKTVSMDMFS